MIIVRKYGKLDWFDFVDTKNRLLNKKPDQEIYVELIDELRMRLLESLSEGATFKMKKLSVELVEQFQARREEDQSFCTEEQLENFLELAKDLK